MQLSLPKYDERVLFVGSNGTGKSILAARLLAQFPRYVVIDVKGDVPIEGTVLTSPTDIRWRFAKRIVYRPRRQWMFPEAHRYVLDRLYERARGIRSREDKRFVLYIDEALYLANEGARRPLISLAVTTRSLGMGLWGSAQRPRTIPVEMRSEAWRWYVFSLGYEEDEKEIARYTKGELTAEELRVGTEQYSFYEIMRKSGSTGLKITHYPPLRI